VDAPALERLGWDATLNAVRQQGLARIDIGNNGEQQREAFFLYIQHRMSGFEGAWTRPPLADVARYAGFRSWMAEQDVSVSRRPRLTAPAGRFRRPWLRGRPCSSRAGVR